MSDFAPESPHSYTRVTDSEKLKTQRQKFADTCKQYPHLGDHYFTELCEEMDEIGMRVMVDDPNTQSRYEFEPRGSVPDTGEFLFIHDYNTFLNISNSIRMTGVRSENLWAQKYPTEFFWNASIGDLLQPEKFLQRVENEIKDTTFTDLSERKVVGDIAVLDEVLSVQREDGPHDCEAANQLNIRLSRNIPTALDELPAVRYGIANKKATIYAIQLPQMGDGLESGIKNRVEKDKKMLISDCDLLKNIFANGHGEFVKIFGEVPEDVFEIDDPTLFADTFATYIERNSGGDSLGWVWDRELTVPRSVVDRLFLQKFPHDLFADLMQANERLKNAPGVLQQYVDRRKRLARLNKPLRSRMINSSPGALASLTTELALFQSRGITEVSFPLSYPLRTHDDDGGDSIDARITEQIVDTVRRIREEVYGVDIKVNSEDHAANLELVFTDILKSSVPLLQELIAAIQQMKHEDMSNK